MYTAIARALIAAMQGSRRVQFTFKNSQASALSVEYLIRMVDEHQLIILNKSRMTLLSAAATGKWENDSDRTVEAILANKFDDRWFLSRLRNNLEKLEQVAHPCTTIVL